MLYTKPVELAFPCPRFFLKYKVQKQSIKTEILLHVRHFVEKGVKKLKSLLKTCHDRSYSWKSLIDNISKAAAHSGKKSISFDFQPANQSENGNS
jgi:hypothetical protein